MEPAQLGSFVTPATVWPGPRLPSGTAALSRSLAAALGRPSPGATLCLYAWPGGAQAFSGQEAAAVTPVATEVSLWQCTSSFTGQPLMLDQGTSAVVGNPTAGESPAGRPAAASAMPVYSGTPKQRSIAEEAAKRLLTGRRLLPGNLVVLPVLGKQVVLAVRDCSHAGGACSDWEAVTVGSNTAVHVLLGADTPACAAAPANGAAPHEVALCKLSMHTLHGSPFSNGQFVAPTHLIVPCKGVCSCAWQALSAEEAAAAAAAAAVGGGLEGPAAVAARRAAALGQAALRHGFAGLGGVSEQIRALREHVALPLQACLLCPILLSCIAACWRGAWPKAYITVVTITVASSCCRRHTFLSGWACGRCEVCCCMGPRAAARLCSPVRQLLTQEQPCLCSTAQTSSPSTMARARPASR